MKVNVQDGLCLPASIILAKLHLANTQQCRKMNRSKKALKAAAIALILEAGLPEKIFYTLEDVAAFQQVGVGSSAVSVAP